jgi:hypothetical protein
VAVCRFLMLLMLLVALLGDSSVCCHTLQYDLHPGRVDLKLPW